MVNTIAITIDIKACSIEEDAKTMLAIIALIPNIPGIPNPGISTSTNNNIMPIKNINITSQLLWPASKSPPKNKPKAVKLTTPPNPN